MGTLRWLRTAILGTAVGAALLGALTTPPGVTLLGAPLVGAVSAAVVLVVAWGRDSPRPSPRLLHLTGVVGTFGLPFACGLLLLGSAGAVLLALLLLVTSVRPAEHLRTSHRSAVRR